MTSDQKADIGVFGGSGFYSFLEETEEYEIDTPYGNPSDKIVIGRVGGKNGTTISRRPTGELYP